MIRLELERRRRGLTLKELAEELDVSESLLCKVERGYRTLTESVGERAAFTFWGPERVERWKTLRKRV